MLRNKKKSTSFSLPYCANSTNSSNSCSSNSDTYVIFRDISRPCLFLRNDDGLGSRFQRQTTSRIILYYYAPPHRLEVAIRMWWVWVHTNAHCSVFCNSQCNQLLRCTQNHSTHVSTTGNTVHLPDCKHGKRRGNGQAKTRRQKGLMGKSLAVPQLTRLPLLWPCTCNQHQIKPNDISKLIPLLGACMTIGLHSRGLHISKR